MLSLTDLPERSTKVLEVRNPGGRVQFQDKRFGITVQNQAGQAIILTVNEPITRGI